jgi:transcription factor SPN1
MGDSREGSPDSAYSAGDGNGSARAPRVVDDDSEEEGLIRPPVEEEEVEAEPVEREDPKTGRGRKRLVKKAVVEESDDEDRDAGRGRRQVESEEEEEEPVERRSSKKPRREDRGRDSYREKSAKAGKGSIRGKKGEKEMNEMWDSVAGDGNDSGDDDRFIDDEGVPEEDRVVYSDGEGSDRDRRHPEAEEAEEEDEDGRLFGKGKKKKKQERTPEEIAMFVEQFMAKLDVAAETDADLNRNSKPAIEKLKMLSELWSVLQKRQLQMEFLDRGVLSSLKDWLEPLPDGSLPNMNIRTTLLQLLTDLPIDVEQFERREQLKKSGLGKVVMFLSRLPEETPANKKLARDLVDKWSRPIFQKSTRYEDLRTYDEDRPLPRRTPAKKPPVKRANMDKGDDLDMLQGQRELKRGDPGYRQHASRPEALALDFVRRPESKVDPNEFQNRARQQRQDEKRMKMNKKLQQLKTTKKSMQASKISVEGRGAVNYF